MWLFYENTSHVLMPHVSPTLYQPLITQMCALQLCKPISHSITRTSFKWGHLRACKKNILNCLGLRNILYYFKKKQRTFGSHENKKCSQLPATLETRFPHKDIDCKRHPEIPVQLRTDAAHTLGNMTLMTLMTAYCLNR